MPCYQPFRGDTSQMLLFKIASCLEASGAAGAAVLSFNGRTGDVVLTLADVAAVADDIYVNESGDTMTGPLVHPDGTAALPSITFTGDLNTGIYHPAADTFSIATSGVSRLNIIPTGEVGIGTSVPVATLGVVGRAMIGNVDVGGTFGVFTGVSGGNGATFQRNGAASGDSGIMVVTGTSITGSFLALNASISCTIEAIIRIQQNLDGNAVFNALVLGTGDAYSKYGINGGQDWSVGLDNSDSDKFKISGSNTLGGNDYLTITSAGEVAIIVGDLRLSTAVRLAMASGANQRAGDAVLVGGTVTVANTTVTANTRVFLTRRVTGGTIGFAVTYTIIAATSFTITSDNVLDTSTYSYLLIEVP